MKSFRTLLAACALSVLAACGGDSDEPTRHLVATFVAAQQDLKEPGPFDQYFPPQPDFSDQTLRQTMRISVGGPALKIKFSNTFGTQPLVLDRIRVAEGKGHGSINVESSKPVTFKGVEKVSIPPGEAVSSDDVAFLAKPLSDVSVSLYIRNAERRTGKRASTTTSFVAPGDQTLVADMSGSAEVTSTYYTAEIAVVRDSAPHVVVAFGDSITEGASTTRDAARNWVDRLSALANAQFEVSVVNAAIGGNRWVKDNTGPCGLCRFDRDVLAVSGVTHVIMTLGINDIGLGYFYANHYQDPSWIVSAADITRNMQAAIDRAKARGLKVLLGTISPFKDSFYYTTGQPDEIPFGYSAPYNGERIRQEVNAFIRGNKSVDGVIDFDAVNQDPADGLLLRPEWTVDKLHPNDAGNAAMAEAVPLGYFR